MPLNKNAEPFFNFTGMGNSKSKIWFIGIEEGGEAIPSLDELEAEKGKCNNEPFMDDAAYPTRVWDIISDLLYDKFINENGLKKEEYRKRLFHKDYSFFFLAELFPLPKSSTDLSKWPEQYKEFFGYGKADYLKYLSDVRKYHYKVVYDAWLTANPDLTICFGSTYHYEFINLLKLGHSDFETSENKKLYYFNNKKIVLTPFFNNYLKSEVRTELKNIIKEVNV